MNKPYLPHRLDVFYLTVQLQSFRKAAQALDLTSSMVSQHIAKLEAEVGARLLNRTTRLLALTPAGERLHQACQQLFPHLEQALDEIYTLQNQLSGYIYINAQTDFGARCVIPLAVQFMQQHPKVDVQVILDDQRRDHIEHKLDMSIVLGKLHDSSYHAVKLGETEPLLCANPDLLKRQGMPEDLVASRNLPHVSLSILEQRAWVFYQQQQKQVVNYPIGTAVSSSQALHAYISAGAGIGVLLDFIAQEQLQKGELVQLFPEWRIPKVGIYALYTNRQHLPERVRCFINFLKENMQPVISLGKSSSNH